MSVQIRGRQILDSTITAAKLVLSDDFTFSGAVSVGTPTADGHAANKGYVDAQLQGLSPKQAVRVLSKANVDISSAPAAIDGVTMANKDRVVLINQSTATENGIYTYASSGAAMSRASDADTFAKLQSAYFFVKEGTSADEGFVQTAELSSFAGQSYVQFSSAGNIVAGDGLAKSGNTLSVNVDDSSLEINSDSLRVKASGISNAMLSGNIENSKLSNSAITIAGASTSLGGSITAASILGAGTTANLPESGNLYFTNARAQAAITVSDSSEVDLSISSGEISAVLKDGSIANARLANSAITIAGASTALGGSITAATILGAGSTSNLSEGSNLYYTDARAQAAITVSDSSEVDLSISSGQISAALKNGSIANARLANSAVTVTAGDGLSGGGSVALGASVSLAVGVDDSTIETNSDQLRIKDSGVSTAKLANGAVTTDKLSFSGQFQRTAIADGTTSEVELASAVDLDFKKFFSVAVNGLLMEYKDTPNAQDNYKIDNSGSGSVGKITFGAALSNGDVVTVRYFA
tara:strand:- start:46 stop:1623 length:1578 start_codon:yes stop_codon:yes gene_type:complete